jgi:hypothetical protein
VARKIGYAGYHPSRVTEMDINVTLGTSYLKMAMDALDNQPVLASAAYNAGPNRARKWRGGQALEGAIYAETIPFAETRDYVKKVMSNAVYYAVLFDDNRSRSRLASAWFTRMAQARKRRSNCHDSEHPADRRIRFHWRTRRAAPCCARLARHGGDAPP